MDFELVESNLRQSFRALAPARPRSAVVELPGVSIAALGVQFQMFNSAFLSSRVLSEDDLLRRLDTAREFFRRQGTDWSFWFCEDWLGWLARHRLQGICGRFSLRRASEMPGMIAREIKPETHLLPQLTVLPVRTPGILRDFQAVGAQCFHVPPGWFSEVFDSPEPARRPGFRTLVAYLDGEPVATAACVPSPGALGLYNIATIPAYRGRGIGEAVTRQAVAAGLAETGPLPVVLQSSPLGKDLYQRLGFRTVARISVYNS